MAIITLSNESFSISLSLWSWVENGTWLNAFVNSYHSAISWVDVVDIFEVFNTEWNEAKEAQTDTKCCQTYESHSYPCHEPIVVLQYCLHL